MLDSVKLHTPTFNAEGRLIVAQSSQGIDLSELPQKIEEIEKTKAKQYQVTVDQSTTEISELSTLNGHLTKLFSALEELTGRQGFGKKHFLSDMQVMIDTYGDATGATPLGIPDISLDASLTNAGRRALLNKDFSISVSQMATKDLAVSSGVTASKKGGLNIYGSLFLGLSDPDAIEAAAEKDRFKVEIQTEDSLQSIADKINRIQEQTKIAAQVVYHNDGTETQAGYALHLQATETGHPMYINKSRLFSDGQVIPSQNHDNSHHCIDTHPHTSFGSLKDKLSAIFSFRGQKEQRPTNQITHLVEGLTLSLKGRTNQTYLVRFETNADAVTKKMTEYCDLHNQLMHYLDEKTALDPETFQPKEGAIFARNQQIATLRSSVASLSSVVTVGSEKTDQYKMLRNVGIVPAKDKNGYVSFDPDKFRDAVEHHLPDLKRLFTFQGNFTDTNDLPLQNLLMLTSPERWPSLQNDAEVAITLNGMKSSSPSAQFIINSTLFNGDVEQSDSGDLTVTAPADSPLKGLKFFYRNTDVSETSKSFKLLGSQGAVDLYSQNIARYNPANAESSLGRERKSIETARKAAQARVTDIHGFAAQKRKDAEAKYAKMQATLAKQTSLKQMLDGLFSENHNKK